jgi:di/tricarboxylate transporter
VIIGIIGGLLASHWEEASTSDRVIWTVLLVGGGILLFLGLRMSRRSPWLGAALISIGAVVGALPIFWTLIAIVVAVVLVVLSVIYARRASGASPATS